MLRLTVRLLAALLLVCAATVTVGALAGQLFPAEMIAYSDVTPFTGERRIVFLDIGRHLPVEFYMGDAMIYDMEYAPDGETLAVTLALSPLAETHVRLLRGGRWRELDFESRSPSGLSWSPDGQQLAMAQFNAGQYDLYMYDLTTDSGSVFARIDGDELEPVWSPDGRHLAFMSYAEFISGWSLTRDTSIIQADTLLYRRLDPLTTGAYNVSWSPDGQEIAYSVIRDGRLNIYVQNVDTGRERELLPSARVDYSGPAWSPDGRQIAFWVEGRLHSIDLESGAVNTLTEDITDGGAWHRWSPDGRKLMFVGDSLASGSAIYVIDFETGITRALVDTNGLTAPVWRTSR